MYSIKTWPAWARNLLWIGIGLASLYILLRWLMPVVLPFALALALARLMEPGVRFLHERWHIPRRVGAALLTLLIVAIILWALWFLLSWLFSEVNDLIDRAPEFISRLPETSDSLSTRMNRLIEAAPTSLRGTLRNAMDGVFASIASIPGVVVQKLTAWVSSFAGKLPYILLFVCAVVLSTFLMSADYPNLITHLLKPFSKRVREKILDIKNQFMGTIGKWLRAQLLMMVITFGELLAGFLILQIKPALLPAGLIALVDALPVLGAGICLIPWAIVCLASGDPFRAAGLAVLYGVAVLVRGFAEPKLVGSQIGLPVLPTFMAMYVGFVTTGVIGMVSFPILLITGKQIWDNSKKKEH